MRYSIVGTQHRKSDDFLRAQPVGTPAVLVREPDNPYDKNAVQVWVAGKFVGFVPKATNKALAARIDASGYSLILNGEPSEVAKAMMGLDSALLQSRAIDARYVISPNSAFPQVEVSDV